MAGKTPKLLRGRSDHTVNPPRQTPSGSGLVGKTPKRRRRSDRPFNTKQQYALSGPLVGKTETPELYRRSVKSQRPTLSGSLVKLAKTPKFQVDLPLHLVAYQILTRLPLKSLCRFRCVSKPLRSCISDPHFRKEHARLSQQPPRLLLVAEADTTVARFSTHTIHGEQLLKDVSLSFALPRNSSSVTFNLIQSCLGLLCITTHSDDAILVFNPSTKEVITLPPRTEQKVELTLGFGYSDISHEFKVVRFFTRNIEGDFDDTDWNPERQECLSEVFTLGSCHGWRETRTRPPFTPYGFSRLPLVHGALHFLPSDFYHPDKRHGHYITAFDVHTEQYRLVPLPKIYSRLKSAKSMYQCQMTQLRGSLCVSCYLFGSKQMLQLWFLKDYHGGKWVKECNIDIDLYYQPLYSQSFAVTDDGYVLLTLRSSEGKSWMCYYNTQNNCTAATFPISCSAVFHVDSFLPLPLENRFQEVTAP